MGLSAKVIIGPTRAPRYIDHYTGGAALPRLVPARAPAKTPNLTVAAFRALRTHQPGCHHARLAVSAMYFGLVLAVISFKQTAQTIATEWLEMTYEIINFDASIHLTWAAGLRRADGTSERRPRRCRIRSCAVHAMFSCVRPTTALRGSSQKNFMKSVLIARHAVIAHLTQPRRENFGTPSVPARACA